MANLDESNIDEMIDKAIEKYFQKGLVVDALFWSKAIAILRDKVRRYKVRKELLDENSCSCGQRRDETMKGG